MLIYEYLAQTTPFLEDFLKLKLVVNLTMYNPNTGHTTMVKRFQKFIRIWRISPRLALAYLTRRVKRQASRLIPVDDWNRNWLGEEMRPFNSLR
ncbi:MAG: hypothetical protein RMJ33_12820 [Saprospiraceae bacterium]|nr:hypothetical protein [Saprospiraceae bacterium]MDW8230710.1 hypothetical protein [Saprospiraceae bacterium]